MYEHSDSIKIAFVSLLVLVGTGFIIAALARHISVGKDPLVAPDAAATSAIIAYYSAGHHLLNTGTGLADGTRYNMYMTTVAQKGHSEALVRQPAVIYVLDLPFNAQTHLLGVGKSYQLDRLQFASFAQAAGLQQVSEAGELLAACDLYAPANQVVQANVLSPEALTFVEQYCTSHFWELHDSELYVVVPDAGIGNAQFITQTQQFISSIEPLLPPIDPNVPVTHHEVPYDMYDGPSLTCPICTKRMELHDSRWFMCTDGHGVLITGSELGHLRAHRLKIIMNPAGTTHHGPLQCPHCQQPMQRVNYNNGKIELDACTNCVFCWLDADEVSHFAKRKKLFGIF
jgi:hypothetical protein